MNTLRSREDNFSLLSSVKMLIEFDEPCEVRRRFACRLSWWSRCKPHRLPNADAVGRSGCAAEDDAGLRSETPYPSTPISLNCSSTPSPHRWKEGRNRVSRKREVARYDWPPFPDYRYGIGSSKSAKYATLHIAAGSSSSLASMAFQFSRKGCFKCGQCALRDLHSSSPSSLIPACSGPYSREL